MEKKKKEERRKERERKENEVSYGEGSRKGKFLLMHSTCNHSISFSIEVTTSTLYVVRSLVSQKNSILRMS